MTRTLIEAAVTAGARRAPECHLLGLSVRTVERWRLGTAPAAPDAPQRRIGGLAGGGRRPTR